MNNRPHGFKRIALPRCGVCKHPDRALYESKILSGELAQLQAAEAMGVDPSAVSRHMSNCLSRQIQEATSPEPTEHALNCVNILISAHGDLRDVYLEARANGDLRSAIRALEAETRQVHEIAVLTGQTQDVGNVNILMLPQYVEFKNTVLAAVRDFPEVKARISAALKEQDDASN